MAPQLVSMDCDICFNVYDANVRRPKTLPCGHTYCMACVIQLENEQTVRCPEDRKVFHTTAANLPDTFFILSRLEDRNRRQNSSRRKWCMECSSEAGDSCSSEQHMRVGLQRLRRQQIAEQAEAIGKVIKRMDDGLLSLRRQVEAERRRNQDFLESLQEMTDPSLPCIDEELWNQYREQASDLLKNTWLPRQTDHIALVVEAEDERWRADGLPLTEHPGITLLLDLLVRRGLLRCQWDRPAQDGARRAEVRLCCPGARAHASHGVSPSSPTNPLEIPSSQQHPPRPQPALVSRDTQCPERFHEPTESEERPVMRRELHFDRMSGTRPGEHAAEKSSLLVSSTTVQVLGAMRCDGDPAWCLAMLWKHGQHLEELDLFEVSTEHMLAALAMPRLRRLGVLSCQENLKECSVVLDPRWENLQVLHLGFVPLQTVVGLLAACRNTLEELKLRVGTPPREGRDHWPQSCSDLPALLSCLGRLQSLTLLRWEAKHVRPKCIAQLNALRRALPACPTIQCKECGISCMDYVLN